MLKTLFQCYDVIRSLQMVLIQSSRPFSFGMMLLYVSVFIYLICNILSVKCDNKGWEISCTVQGHSDAENERGLLQTCSMYIPLSLILTYLSQLILFLREVMVWILMLKLSLLSPTVSSKKITQFVAYSSINLWFHPSKEWISSVCLGMGSELNTIQ